MKQQTKSKAPTGIFEQLKLGRWQPFLFSAAELLTGSRPVSEASAKDEGCLENDQFPKDDRFPEDEDQWELEPELTWELEQKAARESELESDLESVRKLERKLERKSAGESANACDCPADSHRCQNQRQPPPTKRPVIVISADTPSRRKSLQQTPQTPQIATTDQASPNPASPNPSAANSGHSTAATSFPASPTVFQILKTVVPLIGNQLNQRARDVFVRMGFCKTKPLGRHDYHCEHCQHQVIVYNPCGERHCTLCSRGRKEQWLNATADRLVPQTAYLQIIFTVPDRLAPLFAANPKRLYRLLMKTAWEQLKVELIKAGVQPGAIMILHTWNQRLQLHPHVHILVPRSEKGVRPFRPSAIRFPFVSVLEGLTPFSDRAA